MRKPRLLKWQEKLLKLYSATLWLDLLLLFDQNKSVCAFNILIIFLWFVSLSFLWLDKAWMVMSGLCVLVYYIYIMYCILKFHWTENEKGGVAPSPSALPQQEVCCAELWARWKPSREAGKAAWHSASCWPSDGAKRHSVTLWVFLSADSTPTKAAAATLRQAELRHNNPPDGATAVGTGNALHADGLAHYWLHAR